MAVPSSTRWAASTAPTLPTGTSANGQATRKVLADEPALVGVDRENAPISRSPVLNMTELCVYAWLARQRASQSPA